MRSSVLLSMLCIVMFTSCKHNDYVLPTDQRKGDPSLCFETDILPIFITQCAKSGCHDAATHEKGYQLDSYENIRKRGIVPGNPAASKIYGSIIGTEEEKMPKDAPALSDDQRALLYKWITAGAVKDSNCSAACDSDNILYSTGIRPLINNYCSGCHMGSNIQGNTDLSTYDGIKNAVNNNNLVKCINYTSGYNGMPQGMHLSNCQIRQIEKWIEAGMQNN